MVVVPDSVKAVYIGQAPQQPGGSAQVSTLPNWQLVCLHCNSNAPDTQISASPLSALLTIPLEDTLSYIGRRYQPNHFSAWIKDPSLHYSCIAEEHLRLTFTVGNSLRLRNLTSCCTLLVDSQRVDEGSSCEIFVGHTLHFCRPDGPALPESAFLSLQLAEVPKKFRVGESQTESQSQSQATQSQSRGHAPTSRDSNVNPPKVLKSSSNLDLNLNLQGRSSYAGGGDGAWARAARESPAVSSRTHEISSHLRTDSDLSAVVPPRRWGNTPGSASNGRGASTDVGSMESLVLPAPTPLAASPAQASPSDRAYGPSRSSQEEKLPAEETQEVLERAEVSLELRGEGVRELPLERRSLAPMLMTNQKPLFIGRKHQPELHDRAISAKWQELVQGEQFCIALTKGQFWLIALAKTALWLVRSGGSGGSGGRLEINCEEVKQDSILTLNSGDQICLGPGVFWRFKGELLTGHMGETGQDPGL